MAEVETDASAQLLEEALQQSVLVSEGEGQNDQIALRGELNEVAHVANAEVDVAAKTDEDGDYEMDDEGSGQENGDDRDATRDAQAEFGADTFRPVEEEHGAAEGGGSEDGESDEEGGKEDDEDGEFDDEPDADADAEDEDDTSRQPAISRTLFEGDEVEEAVIEDDDDEVDEGVGAVKIKPGDTDDEEESEDSGISQSDIASNGDSDGAAAWEHAAESAGEDEESEEGAQNICIFCKEDEEHDPAPEFEAFLTCSECGENAHQQCARDEKALAEQQAIETWKCPDCVQQEPEPTPAQATSPNGAAEEQRSPPQRRSSAPKLARDLLPSQKGTIKPDSHSVFNQLVLDEDPMDGSRILRKRKTSSCEADEVVMSLRKRRRNSSEEPAESKPNWSAASRPVRLKLPGMAPATVWKRNKGTLVMKFKVNPTELQEILSRRPKRQKKQGGRVGRPPKPVSSHGPPLLDKALIATPFTSSGYSQPFYSFYDKDRDEMKGKPYGGILSEAEADTSKTYPSHEDRKRFDEAKKQADDEWKQRILALQADAAEAPVRRTKKSAGPASQIECIEFGGWEIDTWYAAPYPEEYSRNRVLYICEFCLKYMNSDYVAWRHKLKCPVKHPPGDEIYRHGSASVFEVDGRKNPVYCQNLCLLAKLFLGSKTLYYDVEPFLFYVLCEYDDLGYHFVGYFSKEKRASSQNNVSCILTLPIHQRKGYGNLLIDFSYLLTRVEEKTGSPEKPLSDMGLVSYRNYWRLVMCRYLVEHVPDDKTQPTGLSIKQISDDTGLTPDDVISSLEGLRCLVRDPYTQLYAFRVDLPFCKEYVAKWDSKKYVKLDPKALTWTPYVMGRTNASNFELGPALNAIAPRGEEEEAKPAVVVVVKELPNGPSAPAAEEVPVAEEPMPTSAETEPTILQSTEPDEAQQPSVTADDAAAAASGTGAAQEAEKPLTNGAPVNGVSDTAPEQPDEPEAAPSAPELPKHWTSAYEGIPPTRFQVYPPFIGGKRGAGRPPGPRPTPSRVTSSSSVIRRPRRSLAGTRRSTASKPRSASFQRKSGGTGRGPGRWPKGTKKSDYGNADSGPGLPPAWIAARMAAVGSSKSRKDGGGGGSEGTLDTVQVQMHTDKAQGQRPGAAVKAAEANGVSREASTSKGGRSTGSSRSSKEETGEDVEMDDAEDDGEEEEEDEEEDEDEEEEEEDEDEDNDEEEGDEGDDDEEGEEEDDEVAVDVGEDEEEEEVDVGEEDEYA